MLISPVAPEAGGSRSNVSLWITSSRRPFNVRCALATEPFFGSIDPFSGSVGGGWLRFEIHPDDISR